MVARTRSAFREPGIWLAVEILIVFGWTRLLAHQVLDFDPWKVVYGRDYFNNAQGNHFWVHLRSCGACALWNGDLNGGAPALVDSQSPILHPVVALTTLSWGVVNGAKISVFLALLLAGLAQLWIGYELKTGRLARLVMAMVAVGAGHMLGPLEGGLVGMALGYATAAFVVGSILHLRRVQTTRSLALLSVSAAILAVSGQGYAQVAAVLLIPIGGLCLVGSLREKFDRIVGWTVAVSALTFALASSFLIPFLRYSGNLSKDQDSSFSTSQPFRYIPLNLVIDDWVFFNSESLSKQPFPFFYFTYVGWIVVALAVVGLAYGVRHDRPVTLFFSIMAVGAFALASTEVMQFLYSASGFSSRFQEFVGSLRNISIVSKFAVVPILGFAAIGLDRLMRWRPMGEAWSVQLSNSNQARSFRFAPDLRILGVLLALLVLVDIRDTANQWLFSPQSIEEASVEGVLDPLQSDDLQWVNVLWGETWMLPFTVPAKLKIADQWRPWRISYAPSPPPQIEIRRSSDSPPSYQFKVEEVTDDGYTVYRNLDAPSYVSVEGAPGESPCLAVGEGGNIDITCDLPQAASIQVLELGLAGWTAKVNGESADVSTDGDWLAVDAPAGKSTIELRYRPWHTWIWATMLIIGLVWAAVWLIRPTNLNEWQFPFRQHETDIPPEAAV